MKKEREKQTPGRREEGRWEVDRYPEAGKCGCVIGKRGGGWPGS